MKNVLATLAGFIVGSAVVYFFESVIGHNLFPLPEGADPMNTEWISNNMDQIPVGTKLCVVLAHFFGIVVGMYIAALISKKSLVPSYIAGGFLLAATLIIIIMLPKELWFSLSDGLLAVVGFVIGRFLAKKQLLSS